MQRENRFEQGTYSDLALFRRRNTLAANTSDLTANKAETGDARLSYLRKCIKHDGGTTMRKNIIVYPAAKEKKTVHAIVNERTSDQNLFCVRPRTIRRVRVFYLADRIEFYFVISLLRAEIR